MIKLATRDVVPCFTTRDVASYLRILIRINKKILCFIKNLFTNSHIYSFDSKWVLKQLFQNESRFRIFSLLFVFVTLNKVSINRSKLKNLLQSLNFYTFNHQIKLNNVQKSIDLMNVDLILTRDAAKVLFKVNMIKKTRKKTKNNITREYRISFEQVLIENEAIRLWKDEIKKNDCENEKISRCR